MYGENSPISTFGYILAAYMLNVYHRYQHFRSLPFMSKDQVEQIENFLLGDDGYQSQDRPIAKSGRDFYDFGGSGRRSGASARNAQSRKMISQRDIDGDRERQQEKQVGGPGERRQERQVGQVGGLGEERAREYDSVDFGGTARRKQNSASMDEDAADNDKLVVSFSMFGGVGNQIYYMLEVIYLVRKLTSAILVMPSMLPRSGMNKTGYNAIYKPITPPSDVWDTQYLSRKLPNTRITENLPKLCDGRIDILYMFVRPWQKLPSTVNFTIPEETRAKACALTLFDEKRGSWGNWNETTTTTTKCNTMFENTQIRLRKQHTGSIAAELKNLPRPNCVWITGHSYDRQGDMGTKYLFKFIHYLNLHPRYTAQVFTRFEDVDRMAVVHIRHDEKLCNRDRFINNATNDNGNVNSTEICVRKRHGNGAGAVFWTPVKKYAILLEHALADSATPISISSVYFAISPTMPASMQRAIRDEFSSYLNVIPPPAAQGGTGEPMDALELNLLERELAIEASVFIGDFSTWSSTVHYKRRTYGKTSLWANNVLGKPCRDDCRGTKYHEDNEPISEPPPVRKSLKARLFGDLLAE